MQFFFTLLLWLLGVLLLLALLLVVAVLAIPTHFEAAGTLRDDLVAGTASIWWAAGLVRVRASSRDGLLLRILGFDAWQGPVEAGPKKPKKPKEKKKKKKRKGRLPSRQALMRLARRTLRSLRLRAAVGGRLGSGDPASTAQLFGLVAAARAIAPNIDTQGLQFDWLEPTVDLDGQVQGRVWPLGIAWIAASELWWAR